MPLYHQFFEFYDVMVEGQANIWVHLHFGDLYFQFYMYITDDMIY